MSGATDATELLANIVMGLARQLGAKAVGIVVIESQFLGTGGTVAVHPSATPAHVEGLRLGLLNVANSMAAVTDDTGQFKAPYFTEAKANPDVRCIACQAVTGHKPACPLGDKEAS